MLLIFVFVDWNTFSIYRDNAYINFLNGNYGLLLEDHNFDCVGNEAVIQDCPKNNEPCPAVQKFIDITKLRCKSMKKSVYVNGYIIKSVTYSFYWNDRRVNDVPWF